MPIHTYKCPAGHVTEQFFATFESAEIAEKLKLLCLGGEDGSCKLMADRVDFIKPPLPAHFYGNPDGYYKPSPLKRYSTKLVSQKEGNDSAAGFSMIEAAILSVILLIIGIISTEGYVAWHFISKFW